MTKTIKIKLGKQLNVNDLLNMDEKEVVVFDNNGQEQYICTVDVKNKVLSININPNYGYYFSDINTYMSVYEFSKEEQQKDKTNLIENENQKYYSGIEIQQMIDENKIDNKYRIFGDLNGRKFEFVIDELNGWDKKVLCYRYLYDDDRYAGKTIFYNDLIRMKFIIKEKEKQYYSLEEVLNSNKQFRHKDWDVYCSNLKDILSMQYNLVNSYEDLKKFMINFDEKVWEIKED